jgi:hypothetical protein
MILQRDDQNAERILGTIGDDSGVLAQTLELGWHDNQPDVSCIPAGTYECVLKFSPEHNMNLYWITGVTNRADVEIHIGNFPSNTKGCVLLGDTREADAIDNSGDAFHRFMAAMNGAPSFPLTIADVPVAS